MKDQTDTDTGNTDHARKVISSLLRDRRRHLDMIVEADKIISDLCSYYNLLPPPGWDPIKIHTGACGTGTHEEEPT